MKKLNYIVLSSKKINKRVLRVVIPILCIIFILLITNFISLKSKFSINTIAHNIKLASVDGNVLKNMKEDKIVIVKFIPVIENPKTGINNFIIPSLVISSLSLIAYIFVRRKNYLIKYNK